MSHAEDLKKWSVVAIHPKHHSNVSRKKKTYLWDQNPKFFFCLNVLHNLFSCTKSDYIIISFFSYSIFDLRCWGGVIFIIRRGVLNWAFWYWEVNISKTPRFQRAKKRENSISITFKSKTFTQGSITYYPLFRHSLGINCSLISQVSSKSLLPVRCTLRSQVRDMALAGARESVRTGTMEILREDNAS